MSENPIQGLMKTAMESIKAMVDVNTIVGDAVQASDGTLVIPISRVCFGFAAGGGEFSSCCSSGSSDQSSDSSKFPFAGGSGAGVSIQPVAFMIVAKDDIRLMSVCPNNSVDKLIDLVPDMIKKANDLITNKLDSKDSEKGGSCKSKDKEKSDKEKSDKRDD
jgi:sporulation protein YtfJ